jgi:hypothetical protein
MESKTLKVKKKNASTRTQEMPSHNVNAPQRNIQFVNQNVPKEKIPHAS